MEVGPILQNLATGLGLIAGVYALVGKFRDGRRTKRAEALAAEAKTQAESAEQRSVAITELEAAVRLLGDIGRERDRAIERLERESEAALGRAEACEARERHISAELHMVKQRLADLEGAA